MAPPWDSLPEHLNSPEKWNGMDDDQHWYTKWRKSVKGWFAYGPRSKHKWAKWREFPKLIFAVNGAGFWRFEDDISDGSGGWLDKKVLSYTQIELAPGWYLSRNQYWCRWHAQLQWPLFFCFHFFWKENDIKLYSRGKLKGWMGYIGAKRDADKIYWCPAIYLGTNFK